MKAIGKGSIASILATILHLVRIVLFAAFAGLSIALSVMGLAAAIAPFVSEGARIAAEVLIDPEDLLNVASHFVTFGVLLYVVNRLLEVLKTLRFETPFTPENPSRFRRIGIALLIGEAAQVAFWLVGEAFDAGIDDGIDLLTLVAVAAVFVLAEVFSEGASMKAEQDLTV